MDGGAETKTKSGWTLWKEIYGTFIGILPFIILILAWGQSITSRVEIQEYKISAIEKAEEARARQLDRDRQDILNQLAKITNQIETLQQTVAKEAAINSVRGRRDVQ